MAPSIVVIRFVLTFVRVVAGGTLVMAWADVDRNISG